MLHVLDASEHATPWGGAGSSSLGHVAVVGGGIAGLSAALGLLRHGARVSLIEASGHWGGLGSVFQPPALPQPIERFYHCMVPSDAPLLRLLKHVDLADAVHWQRTSFGHLHNQHILPLNGALDLLRFDALTVVDRLRVGLTGLWGRMGSGDGLDDVSCAKWLRDLSGARAFDAFWRPMLRAKFGNRYEQVPALWFWTRFRREKGQGPERKGYVAGGYRRITQALVAAIAAAGGRLLPNTRVLKLGLNEQGLPWATLATEPDGQAVSAVRTLGFDRVVYTAPWPLLQGLADAHSLMPHLRQRAGPALGLDMQGVINVVLVLKRSLSPHYWVSSMDPSCPFQGIVETSHLIAPEQRAGLHLAYLTHYLHRSDLDFTQPDDGVISRYVNALLRRMPELKADDIVSAHVCRSAHVEPLYTLGYHKRKPPECLVDGRVYLATSHQVYPDPTSWNGSAGLVERVLAQVLADAGAYPGRPAMPQTEGHPAAAPAHAALVGAT